MNKTARRNTAIEWRQRQRQAGGRTVFATIGPEAAAALAQLQAGGATLRQVLEDALIAHARRSAR